jgi:pimeloyl-ACP methyl ester carboxylesterase
MLAHARRGSGPALLLLHGLGAAGAVWEPVLDLLAAERDVVTVDLPGFGASDPLPEGTPATAANMATAVHELCRSLSIERPHLAGNSLGAWTALEGGRQGWAASVTAISPAGLWRAPLGPRSRDVRGAAKRLRPLISLALRSRRIRRFALQGTFAHPERVPPEAARASILNWIDSPSYDDANFEMRASIFDPAGYPQIPVTIAWGEHDRLVGPPKPERRPAGARFLVLPDVGHTPTWDDPELVARVLLEGSSRTAQTAGA